jgi:anthranilate phosphoribosyltransferase
MLGEVASLLRKLSYRKNLSAEEAKQALDIIGAEDTISNPDQSDGLFLLALTFGLMAKGPTADELFGLATSIRDNSAKFHWDIDTNEILDVSGTGGDSIKTLNVGTAASFVVAAAGLRVAKQATGAYTGKTGSADIFRELGLDVFSLRDPKAVERCLKDVGVSGFYPPAFSQSFNNRIAFLQKLRRIGLLYLTPWHLVAWIPSPAPMSSRLYGVFAAEYVEPLAQVFKGLGYERALVVHGLDGLDEVSTVGRTLICELRDGESETYEIEPADLGLKRAEPGDLAIASQEESLESFFRVLLNFDRGPRRDLVAANAGAALYIAGKVKSLREGAELALELLTSGAAAEKLERFCSYMGTSGALEAWRRRLRGHA